MPAGKMRVDSKTGEDDELRELAAIFRELNNQQEFEPLAGAVLRTACRLFRMQAATLFLTNKRTGILELAAAENVPGEMLEAYRREPAGSEWLEKFPFAAEQAKTSRLRELAAAGFSGFVIWPIVIQEKKIGCMGLASDPMPPESPQRVICRDLFMEYVAQAIENAYLIFQLRERNSRLETMMTKLQNAQEDLKRTEKMALVGKMAAAVAHEIRNPLTIIGASLQMVREKMEPGHVDRGLYDIMLGKVQAMDQTIKELMIFARPLTLHPARVPLSSILEKVALFIGKKFESHRLKLEFDLPPKLPAIRVDEEQIQRIFINLLLNAYHFLPEAGCVRVMAREESDKSRIAVSVADNGPGISPEHAQKLFEPFFTTRPEGTGLGLFLVKHLLEEMGGEIELRASGSEGTEFVLRLPQGDAGK